MIKLYAKLVPLMFTADGKLIQMPIKAIHNLENTSVFPYLPMAEMWFYYYTPESKQQSIQ